MCRVILSILFFGFISITFADSAVQTDWSGGDGIYGPVIDWGNEFYQSSSINWSGYPGIMLLVQVILEHTVEEYFSGAKSVYAADVNGDGYMDVLGAASVVDDITWWDLTEYLPDGSLESSILDTQISPDWDYFEWNS